MDFEEISGRFVFTVYKTSTYMVSTFETDDDRLTVTGPAFDYIKSKKYTLTGEFVDHPKYGFQFNYVKVDNFLPKKEDEIVNFLSSFNFSGIGKKTATRIYNYFKDDTLNILKEDPQRIFDVGLTSKQSSSIIEGFASLEDPKNESIFKLISGGFSNSESLRIYDYFKENINDALKNNPYLIYLKVYGIPYLKVCDYASNYEFENKDIRHKEAFLVYLFKDLSFLSGDTYLYIGELENQYIKNTNDKDFDEVLELSIKDDYLIKEEDRVYLYDEYHNEKLIADYLNNFNSEVSLSQETINEALFNLSSELDIEYDDCQKDAINSFFSNGISIITGGPGTGKTTIVKSLVSIYKNYLPFNNIVVVAPTGRAAKRICEICNVESKTIHSLLKWDKETNTFSFNSENKILYDAIIIDEFSMVDNFLFASLLKACDKVTKICLIGDPNQLPSIRQGNLLFDMLESNKFTLTKLSRNHRQKEGSEIIDLSYDIINDDCDLSKYSNDIEIIRDADSKKIIELIDEKIDEGFFFDDIQVLAPMYKGPLGITNLNRVLQSYFNPQSKDKNERVVGEVTFREGDRILQLKNRPQDDIYNGDIGILEEINFEEKYFLINYSDNCVFFKFDDLDDISLAYALSVHKAQGSEYNVCLFVVPNGLNAMLNKKLMYTAVTRAKRNLYIIGNINNFYLGVSRESKGRKTTLKERLLGIC